MKVYTKSGTKERLFEMMSGVNKIKLNEDIAPNYVVINNIIDQIKSGRLKVDKISNNLNGNITELSLQCSDNGDQFTAFLTFQITFNQGADADAGVYDIQDVKLASFETVMNAYNYTKTFDENDINRFNQTYGDSLVNFVENYLDVDTDTNAENITGIEEETTTLIDSIIKDKDNNEIHRYY